MKTMKELAQEAIDVQSAVNLSGIVHAFSRAMTDLREHARSNGWECTDKINQHPIAVLFADKIASLTCPGSSINGSSFSKAYNWCVEESNVV